jgi:ABC-type transporter MlaC component
MLKKCKVMHLGRGNSKSDYEMAGSVLDKTREEKDLGVIVSDTLKTTAQAALTALSVLGQITRAFQYHDKQKGQITRAFHYHDKQTFEQLYKQYVRPHLDFAVQAWSPWLQADIKVLERVQQRAVKMVSGLRSQDYCG